MISKIQNTYRKYGLRGLISVAFNEVFPRRAQCLPLVTRIVATGGGLEVGGPSPVFRGRGVLPVYSTIDHLDNCNFSSNTAWEGQITGGKTFKYDSRKNPGSQYISEASDLGEVRSGTYDFLLSSHVLEHLANPLRGLHEWLRVLKESGNLILLVPHYRATFDHQRPVTKLEHLIDDFEQDIGENDLTHLDEILQLHDLAMDPGAGSFEEFEKRSRNNLENRCLHQHVFDNQLVIQLMSHMRLQVLSFENIKPHHILVVAKKIPPEELPDNDNFAAGKSGSKSQDPFR
jgi:predicted SAM-dependent methyltransferase